MWIKTLAAVLLCLAVAAGCATEVPSDLETITPEEAGWSSETLDSLAVYLESVGYSALVLTKGNKVFYGWGEVAKNYPTHSIRKAMLSALYGFYVADGTIDLDMTLAELGIDDSPVSLTEAEKQATVRQLLQGRSGVYIPAAHENQSMRDSRPERGSHEPGTFFYYNNFDFNVAGSIFRQVTGNDIFTEFDRLIARPIGMQDFDPDSCAYEFEEEFSTHPAYWFRISARDLARFGILFLNGGVWEGKQIVPADWFEESTTPHGVMDERLQAGFGYMWGVTMPGGVLEDILGGTGLFFSGAYVHHLVIVNEPDYVFILRMDTDQDWVLPPPESTGKIYGMIKTARVGAP
jgi:CubicO group peptidase (beta-lactamase class C family)